MSDTYKNILCYGDSNTWGCVGRWFETTVPSDRYGEQTRWPCVMRSELGGAFRVIEEGLCGRTTIYPTPGEEWKSGEYYLQPCLQTHRPLDLVIIMLGTNDLLMFHPERSLENLGDGITRLIDIVQGEATCGRDVKAPKILVIAPVSIKPSHPDGRTTVLAKFRNEIGLTLSHKFPEVYERIAREKGCYFMSAADYAHACDGDGVHLDDQSQINLGKAVAEFVKTNIFPTGEEA